MIVTKFTKRLVFCVLCLLVLTCIDVFAQNTVSEWDTPYRLFKTNNIWTFIQLDTITGKMWQIYFDTQGDGRGAVVLNDQDLAAGKPRISGRFTLYETSNMYTFILLDQIDGRTWQVQWSSERRNRFVIPIAE
jgi:hypothetical protein